MQSLYNPPTRLPTLVIVGGTISTPAGVDLTLIPGAGGITIIGDAGSPGHLGTPTNDDFFVSGRLEVDGFAFFDGNITIADDIGLHLGDSDDARFEFDTAQTVDSLMLGVDAVGRMIVICEKADVSTDFGHAAETNPTLFIQSADATTPAQWISAAHDQTSGVIKTGAGNLQLLPAGITQIGDAGSTSHSLAANDDLFISGILEVDGIAYFDAAVIGVSTITAQGSLWVGNTGHCGILPSTGFDQATWGLGDHYGRQLILTEIANYANDHDHAVATDPILFIHSALDPDTDNGEFAGLAYDGLICGTMSSDRATYDFTIKGSNAFGGATPPKDDGGHLILEGGDKDTAGEDGIVQIGSGFTTGHSLVDKSDLGVAGKLEVDGAAYLDGLAQAGGGLRMMSDVTLRLGDSDETTLEYDTGQTVNALVWGLSAASRSLILCEIADVATDFAHAQQTNPTVYIHSADATDVTQWLSLAHNQTDAILESGKGDLVLTLPANKTLKLSQVVWDDLRVALYGQNAGGLKPPAWTKIIDDGAGSVGIYAWAFADEGAAGNEEQMWFAAQLPHGYKEGTDIEVHIHWQLLVGGAAGEFVKWGLEYAWINIDGTVGNSTIITSAADAAATATTSEDGTLVADKHYMTEIGTISGSGKTISSMLMCRVFRNSSHGDDDLAQDAIAHEVDFHYQIDTMGSRSEDAK